MSLLLETYYALHVQQCWVYLVFPMSDRLSPLQTDIAQPVKISQGFTNGCGSWHQDADQFTYPGVGCSLHGGPSLWVRKPIVNQFAVWDSPTGKLQNYKQNACVCEIPETSQPNGSLLPTNALTAHTIKDLLPTLALRSHRANKRAKGARNHSL